MKKNTFRIVASLAILAGLICFTSCSKKDSSPSGKSHKVIFKAIASEGSNIQQAAYGVDVDLTTVSSLQGTTWTSPEITSPAGAVNANVNVEGYGASASSTLKVQIYVDGVLKKEASSSGEVLVAIASYKF